jgi:hypothetical protein
VRSKERRAKARGEKTEKGRKKGRGEKTEI